MMRSAELAVYLVTDAGLCGPHGVTAVVEAAVAGGVTAVQLRDKDADDAIFLAQLARLAEVVDGRALLLADDRLDLVAEARRRGVRVDGVHLGQSDASVLRAREILGSDAIVGLTANTPAHLAAVRRFPPGTVDYLGVGVIHPTATKPDHPPVLGAEGFAALAAQSPLPCVAIGGVGLADAGPLRRTGAAGVAVVSALCAAEDPGVEAARFVRAWRDAAPSHDIPRVLSIAGTDPTGGAGIQADLKAIAANGGYGMAVVTALVAQNTRGVREMHVPPSGFLAAQLAAVSDDVEIDAVKIGMLAAAAEEEIRSLLPLADVVTPNLAELAVLAGENRAATWAEALAQARRIVAATGTRVLVKGGHLTGDDAPDALIGPDGEATAYPGARISTTSTHGTGCSLSTALTTRRARGAAWPEAVGAARAWLRESLRAGDTLDVGTGNGPIHHFAGLWRRGGLEIRPTAEEVAEDWWRRITEIREGIDRLPFVRALANGTLPAPAFRFYLEQDALYLRGYARVLAEAARTAPGVAQQSFWTEASRAALVGETELHAFWLTPGDVVGEQTFAASPAAATTAYLDHLRATAFDGDHSVLTAALLPCFWLYADLGARLLSGEFGDRGGDPSHPYASWLTTYADPGFAASTRRAIALVTASAATAPETAERMYTAFERSAAHERAFLAAPLADTWS